MRKLVVISFLVFGFLSGKAIEVTEHYDSAYAAGNKAYQEQNYEQALGYYTSILEAGLQSADLFYNTGNAHYKLGQSTRAILFYEKALKLNPKGKDIQYNLALANRQIVDKIETLPVPFYKEWWSDIINSLPVDVFAIISIAFLIFTVIAALFFLRTQSAMIKRLTFFLALVFVGVSGSSYLFARSQYQANYISSDAIIVSNRVTIYSAPNTTSTTLFILHDGLKVTILQSENKWNKIMLPDGSVGWIPEEALVVI